MRPETFHTVLPADVEAIHQQAMVSDDQPDASKASRKTMRLRLLTEQCNTLPLYTTCEDISYDFISPMIAHYRIIREIGRGGMGIVYHAFDQRACRDVALKVLDTRIVRNELQCIRFDGEAGMIMAVKHPNVINIHEQGFVDGYAYLSQDLLSGKTLKQQIRQGIQPAVALDYMRQLALALAAIHEQGIIHRDVKPSNILFDQAGKLVLTDFGISERNGTASNRPCNGLPIGTPAYMSPEQRRCQPTDERSDLYSMGVVFYELLTGHPPCRGTTTNSQKDRHTVNPFIPIPGLAADIADLLYALLAARPADRIRSSAEAGEVLLGAERVWME